MHSHCLCGPYGYVLLTPCSFIFNTLGAVCPLEDQWKLSSLPKMTHISHIEENLVYDFRILRIALDPSRDEPPPWDAWTPSSKWYWRRLAQWNWGDSLQSSASLGWRALCHCYPHIIVHMWLSCTRVGAYILKTKGCHSPYRTCIRVVGLNIWGSIPKVLDTFPQETDKGLTLAKSWMNPKHRYYYWAISYPHKKKTFPETKDIQCWKGKRVLPRGREVALLSTWLLTLSSCWQSPLKITFVTREEVFLVTPSQGQGGELAFIRAAFSGRVEDEEPGGRESGEPGRQKIWVLVLWDHSVSWTAYRMQKCRKPMRRSYYSCFTDMDTEAQKSKMTCPRSHSLEAEGKANLTLSNTSLSAMLRVAVCVRQWVTQDPHLRVSHTWWWREEEGRARYQPTPAASPPWTQHHRTATTPVGGATGVA